MASYKSMYRELQADIAQARKHAREQQKQARAQTAHFDRKSKRVIVELTNGATFTFPAKKSQRLASAKPSELARVRVSTDGGGLHWDDIDAHFSVPGLLVGALGSDTWMREIGRKGGSSKSAAKGAAARANGSKGGRPRKARR